MARMLSVWAFHETKNQPFHFRKSWSVYLVCISAARTNVIMAGVSRKWRTDHSKSGRWSYAPHRIGRTRQGLFVLCGGDGVYPALVDPGPIYPDDLPRTGPIQLTYSRLISKQNTDQPAAHTRQPEKNIHKMAVFRAIYSYNRSYPQEKSGNVKLAKILHFWPFAKKHNNI